MSARKGGGGGHTGWGEGRGWRGGEGEELAGVRGGGMGYLHPDRRGGVGDANTESCIERYSPEFKSNCPAETWSGSEEGSYLRLIDCRTTEL